MPIPSLVLDPPFNVTRISHVTLTVRDIEASIRFYSDVLGFVVSDVDGGSVYLRGLEEGCHHSLVLRQAESVPVCQAVGFRVQTEVDLECAKAYFDRRRVRSEWCELAYQGKTLRLADASGSPIELCAAMDNVPRLMQSFEKFHGGSPQRLDHVQIAAPNVQVVTDFYATLGFRLTEYTARDGRIVGCVAPAKGKPP